MRRRTRQINVGGVKIGGNAPVSIQSMVKAHTSDIKAAVSESAQAIVLVHNHPSGLPEPSGEDVLVTRRLAEAGKILGIEVLDHVVLGSQGFVSMRELGHL